MAGLVPAIYVLRAPPPLNGPIASSAAYFGCGAGAPPEVPGGGTTFGSPVVGVGFWMAGSTSFGWMIPFDWLSSLLRFGAGALELAPGVVSLGAGLVDWAKAAPATRVTPATNRQNREPMIRMGSKRVDVRSVPARIEGGARRLFCRERFRRCRRIPIIGAGICPQPDPPLRHTNHPPTGYPSSLRLLNEFKTTYPPEKFVTHEFPVDQVDKAMAQAFDIDSCMKVVLTPSGA